MEAMLSSAAPMQLAAHHMQHLPANRSDAQPEAYMGTQPSAEGSLSHSLQDPAVVHAAHTLSRWQNPVVKQQSTGLPSVCLFDFEDGTPVHHCFLGSRGSESSQSGSIGRVLQPSGRGLKAASEAPAASHKLNTTLPMDEALTHNAEPGI